MSASNRLRVTLFDYGAGNLHSLVKSLEASDVDVIIEPDAQRLVGNTDALVLPGVGAFSHAAARLAPGRDAVVDALRNDLPALCICLGMQLLFEDSEEGPGDGLGLIPGRVMRLASTRIPQIGWNSVDWVDQRDHALDIAYYANSFVCRPAVGAEQYVTAWSEHEDDRFPATVRMGETVGAQFHPEKSSQPGIQFIREFLDRARVVRNTTTRTKR